VLQRSVELTAQSGRSAYRCQLRHRKTTVSACSRALASKAVEALTIVLAVAIVCGRRPADPGALVDLAVLALIVVALGPLFGHLPLHLLRFVIGACSCCSVCAG
jgi:hypothetical protein